MMINRTNMLLLAAAAATAALSFPSVGNAEPRETQSRDGTWEILFDPKNAGRANNWHQETMFSARGDRREIEVPRC